MQIKRLEELGWCRISKNKIYHEDTNILIQQYSNRIISEHANNTTFVSVEAAVRDHAKCYGTY